MSVHDIKASIRSPNLQAIAYHWYLAKKAMRMPSWEKLRPSELSGQLSIIWAYRFDRASGQFQGRLLGNRLMHAVDGKFQGMTLAQVHPDPSICDVVTRILTRVMREPAAFASGGALFRQGDYVVEGERIVLPLSSDGIEGDGVLGASEYLYPPPGQQRGAWKMIIERESWVPV
jgi:hypothetical protein